jgi:dihydropyrimidinase
VLVVGETIAPSAGRRGPAGARVIDASGAYVMPGGIDPHTHMELPFMGTVASEDFFTGTSAAAAGGTTIDHRLRHPQPQAAHPRRVQKVARMGREGRGDYSLPRRHHLVGRDRARRHGHALKEHGVNSFKHFMAYKGAIMADDEILVNSFTRARELGALCTVHAENGELVFRLQKEIFEKGFTGPEGTRSRGRRRSRARPPTAPSASPRCSGVPLYLVHTSCIDALEAITRARLRGPAGVRRGARAAPGHRRQRLPQPRLERGRALRDEPAVPRQGAPGRALAGLQAGMLQTTATDHCCFCTPQKQAGLDDFRKIPNGTGGVEDRMGVLWHHGVRTGRLTPSEFVAVTSTNTAKIFNIHPKKGALAPGADADLVVWDPEKTRTISAKTHHQNIDFNIYEGMTITGNAAVTLSRGASCGRTTS